MKILKKLLIAALIINVSINVLGLCYYFISREKCPIDKWDSESPYMHVYFCEGPSTAQKMTCEIKVGGEVVTFEASTRGGAVYDHNKYEFGHYAESEEEPGEKEWVCELGFEVSFSGKNVIATIYSSQYTEDYPVGMEIPLTPREPKYNYTYYP